MKKQYVPRPGRHRRRPPSRPIVGVTGAGNALRRVIDMLNDSLLRLLTHELGPALNSLPIVGLVLSVAGYLAMPFVGASMIPVMTGTMAAALFGLAATHDAPTAILLAGVAMMLAVAADRATAAAIEELRTRPDRGPRKTAARRIELATTWWCAPTLLAFGIAVWLVDWRPAVRGLACAAVIVTLLAWRFVPRPPRLGLRTAAESLGRAMMDIKLQQFQLLNAGTKSALRCVLATAPLLLHAAVGPGKMMMIVAGTETLGLLLSALLQHPWHLHVLDRGRDRVERYGPDLLVALGAALVLVAAGSPKGLVAVLCVPAALLAHLARTTNNVATQVHVSHASDPRLIVGRQAIHGIWRVLANGVFAIVYLLAPPTPTGDPTRAVLWLAGLAIAITLLTMTGRLLTAPRRTRTA